MIEKEEIISIEDYTFLIRQFKTANKCFLLKIASDVDGKDVYFRNCIAKVCSLLKSIGLLYSVENFNDGWILYRSLIDRLVYLFYLTENNNFKEFDEWSYVKSYEYRHNAKVDERFKRLLKVPAFETKKGETQTYEEFKQRLNWKKPDPLAVLKSKKIDFIYKFGYDYASTHTHPMSKDGSKEFHHLTGLKPNPHEIEDNYLLLKNSLIISSISMDVILKNMSIAIPNYYIEYIEEYHKKAYGFENNVYLKFDETFNKFKKDAGF